MSNLLQPSKILHGAPGQLMPGVPVVITSGQTVSANLFQDGLVLCGIQFPATMTGTAITFNASSDGTTFVPVHNASGPVSYTITGGEYMAITTADLQGAAYLQIVSGTAEDATRTLLCSLKGL